MNRLLEAQSVDERFHLRDAASVADDVKGEVLLVFKRLAGFDEILNQLKT